MMRCVHARMFAVLLQPGSAAAQTCTAVTTDFDFGSVSLRAGAVNQTSVNVKVTRSGGLVSLVGICLTYGGGSANDGGPPPRRYMVGPGGALLEY